MQEIPSMFIYNAICVMSDQLTSKAGTITSGEDRFMEWKTKDGGYENTQYAQFDTFFEGMFQKERLLDIIKNFICFSNEGINICKILPGYHQYFTVKKRLNLQNTPRLPMGRAVYFGIHKEVANLFRWDSMLICYRKYWIVQLLLCLPIEMILIISFTGNL